MVKQSVLALALASLICGGAQSQTLRFGLLEDPDGLDPTFGRSFTGRMVFAAMCDKLVDIDADLNIVPQLATSWSWSDDQKALTLKVRPDVKFQDGEPLDAEAVRYNLERHMNAPGSQRRGELAAVDHVEALDSLTVKIVLKTPFAPLLAVLTDRAGMMISPKAGKALGERFATQPVCAGAFKLVERVAQDKIVLERFDGYWNKDAISIRRIEFRPMPDSTILLNNLRAGQLDLIERLSPTDLPQVRSDSRLSVGKTYELGFQALAVNMRRAAPISADKRIREAFEASIDRQILTDVVFNGEYLAGNQWVSPQHPYYVREFPIPGRDLQKARSLLRDAGAAHPVVKLMAFSDNISQQVAQVIQAMAKEAGFDVQIQTTDFATGLDRADRGDYEVYLVNWSGRPDPDSNTFSFLACNLASNYARYCSARADAALMAGRATTDLTERKSAWLALATEVLNDRPLIYLYHRKLMWGYTKRLSGFGNYPDGLVRYTGLRLN